MKYLITDTENILFLNIVSEKQSPKGATAVGKMIRHTLDVLPASGSVSASILTVLLKAKEKKQSSKKSKVLGSQDMYSNTPRE